MKYNAAPTACETFSYGEVEDYTVSLNKTISYENLNSISLNIYPNPAENILFVQTSEANCKMTIYNSLGAVVMNKNISDDTEEQDIINLKPGVYTICISKDDKFISRKFIKK